MGRIATTKAVATGRMPRKRLEIDILSKQRQFVLSQVPTVTFQGGVGSGKTRAGAMKALQWALSVPGSRGYIVSVTYKVLSRAVMENLETVQRQYRGAADWQHHKQDGRLSFPNGSTIWLGSADAPEGLTGATVQWVWGDEVGLWSRKAYDELQDRLREAGPRRQFFATFTPKGAGAGKWAWEEFGPEREDVEVIRASSADNVFNPPDYLDRLLRRYPLGSAWHRQQVLGQWVSFEGRIYEGFEPEAHVGQPPDRNRFVRIVGGMDWGWENPGVLVVVGLTADDHTWVLSETYQRMRDMEWWAGEARRAMAEWGIDRFYCDPSQPANIDHLRRAGMPVQKAENAVIPGISAVAGRINAGREHVATDCTETVTEYLGYSWKSRSDGTIRPDEPEKVADHAMDARRYAEMGLIRPLPAQAFAYAVPDYVGGRA